MRLFTMTFVVALWACVPPADSAGPSEKDDEVSQSKATPEAPETPPAKDGDPDPSTPPDDAGTSSTDECVAPPGQQLQDQDFSDEQLPWKRTGRSKVVIHFETKDVAAEYVDYMKRAADNWNKSPCLDVRIVDTCPTGTHCVTVKAPYAKTDGDGNFDAVEKGGFTVGGHIDILSGLSKGEKINVVAHEMGHAVGLRHRKKSRVLMNADTYADVFESDPVDYQNLLVLYGNQK